MTLAILAGLVVIFLDLSTNSVHRRQLSSVPCPSLLSTGNKIRYRDEGQRTKTKTSAHQIMRNEAKTDDLGNAKCTRLKEMKRSKRYARRM
jgi:hypothetical protein